MQYVPPPSRPPFNDQLMQALSPVQKVLSDKAKINQILMKNGEKLDPRQQKPVLFQGRQ